MPDLGHRDLAATRLVLRDWLAAKMPRAQGLEVTDLVAPAASGYSNETLLASACWDDDGEVHADYVIRVGPTREGVFPEYDLGLQVAMPRALAAAGVPVAEVLWEEQDPAVLGAAFFVMPRIEGRVPADNPPYTTEGWLKESSVDEQRAVHEAAVDALAAVHGVDWRIHAPFLDGRGRGGLAEELAYWRRYQRWSGCTMPNPVVDAGWAYVEANLPQGDQPRELCWGDARLGNQMFHEGRCVAVLDWEMVCLGDPVMDLAWFCFFQYHFSTVMGAPELPGLLGRDEIVARWEARTGRYAEPRVLELYEVFAGLRFSLIMARIARLYAGDGMLPDDSDFEVNNTATQALAPLLGIEVPGSQT